MSLSTLRDIKCVITKPGKKRYKEESSMREGWKKVVSAMLCAAMVVSMSGLAVSADGENNDLTGNNLTKGEEGSDDLTKGEKDGSDLTKGEEGGNGPAGNDGDGNDLTNNEEGGNGGEDGSEGKTPNNLPPTGPNRIMTLDAQPTNTPTNEEELKAALTDTSIDTITINGEIEISSPIEISREVTITGNGTLKDTKPAPAEEEKPTTNFITVTADNVQIEGITIKSGEGNKYAVQYYLASGTMSGVKVNHGNTGYAPVLINGADVTITNCTMTTSSYALIELAQGDNVSAVPTVNITGVDESTTPLLYADGTQLTTEELAGKITVNGQQPTLQVNGTSIIVSNLPGAQTGVASVNGVSYATLQQAIDKATNGATVVLNKDTTENVTVAEGKNIILDLGSFTLSGGNGNDNRKAAITNEGTLTIQGSGTIKREDNGEPSYYVIDNQGTMTIAGGTIYNNSGNGTNGSSLIRNGGVEAATLNIQGGTLQQDNFIAVKNDDYGTLNVSGGTIISNEQAIQNWNQATITGGTMQGNVYTWGYNTVSNTPETEISGGVITGDVVTRSYDDNTTYIPSVKITGGEIQGKLDTRDKGNSYTESVGKIEVSGGNFGSQVQDVYLDDSLTAELYSRRNPDAPYSYYSSVEDAKAHAMPGDIVKDLKNNTSITIPGSQTDTDRPSDSHGSGSSSSGSNSNVSYTRDPEQDKREAEENMWKRAINKINSARDGSSLKIYTGIVDEIPDYVLDALRENNVTVTFYNQDGDEVTIPAGMAPKSLRDSWTFKQLGNYVLSLDEVVTEVEETTETTQPAAEQNAPAADNTDTAKPNPETGDASSSMMAIAAAAASLCGVVLLSKKNK